MICLTHLSPPPPPDQITVCENEGKFESCSFKESNLYASRWIEAQSVEIIIGQETARPAYSKYDAREAFSLETGSLWEKIISTYNREGFTGSLTELSKNDANISIFVSQAAACLIKLISIVNSLKGYLPYQMKTGSNIEDCNLSSTNIKIIAWHPHTITLAAAFFDDNIRVFAKGRTVTPLLKHRLQKNISHIEWMPYSASILGVSCSSGILLWTLDPLSVVGRPSGSCLSHLSHSSIIPVKSFTWHPKGLLLGCIGGSGNKLMVWDSSKEENSIVHSGFFTKFSTILWSPDGCRLLAAQETAAIKIFECRTWKYERYGLNEPLQSAVWAESGHLLLFATLHDPILYAITFRDEDGVGGSSIAIQVADLSERLFTDKDGNTIKAGGSIKQLAWDKNNERLAVIFKNCEIIAIFHTFCEPQLQLAPGGFIRGFEKEYPVHASFQRNVANGSILSVVWSGGKVKHIPMIYTARNLIPEGILNATHPFINQSTFESPMNNVSRINVSSRFVSDGPSEIHLFSSPS